MTDRFKGLRAGALRRRIGMTKLGQRATTRFGHIRSPLGPGGSGAAPRGRLGLELADYSASYARLIAQGDVHYESLRRAGERVARMRLVEAQETKMGPIAFRQYLANVKLHIALDGREGTQLACDYRTPANS